MSPLWSARTLASPDYVSRGGHKLAGALAAFEPEGLIVEGRRCLDAGASTGGFTDVLLQRGARRWSRSTSGYGQLAWRLRSDERVRRPRPAERPRPDRRGDRRPRSTWWSATCRSSRCASCSTPLLGDRGRRRPGADGEAAVRGRQGAGRQGRRGARPGPARRGGHPRRCGPPRQGWGAGWWPPARCPDRRATWSSSCGSGTGPPPSAADDIERACGVQARWGCRVRGLTRDRATETATRRTPAGCSCSRTRGAPSPRGRQVVLQGLHRHGIVVRLLAAEAADLGLDPGPTTRRSSSPRPRRCEPRLRADPGARRRRQHPAGRRARPREPTPVLGVNLGHVGFLAEAELDDVESTIDAIVTRRYTVEDRLTLDVTCPATARSSTARSRVNEASVEKAARERMLEVVVEIDGRPLSRWGCDGVVCATRRARPPTPSAPAARWSGRASRRSAWCRSARTPCSPGRWWSRRPPCSPSRCWPAPRLRRAVVRRPPHRRPAAGCPDRGPARRAPGPPGALHQAPFTDRLVAKFGLPVKGWRGSAERRRRGDDACSRRSGSASSASSTPRRSSCARASPSITGETGAGKTMIVTALGLLLGGRADTGPVRPGASPRGSRAASRSRRPAGCGAGGRGRRGCRRRPRGRGPHRPAEGRSRAFVGGPSVPVATLAEIADPLIAVHGQSDQHRLLRPRAQRGALDRFGGAPVAELAGGVRRAYRRLRATRRADGGHGHAGSGRRGGPAAARPGRGRAGRAGARGGRRTRRGGVPAGARRGAARRRRRARGARQPAWRRRTRWGRSAARGPSTACAATTRSRRAGRPARRGQLPAGRPRRRPRLLRGRDRGRPAADGRGSERRAALTALGRAHDTDIDGVLAWADQAGRGCWSSTPTATGSGS